MIMKKLAVLLILVFGVASLGYAQDNSKQLAKAQSKMYKVKMKEYKKEGWKIDSPTKTLEVALLEHSIMLSKKDNNGNPLYYELVGNCTDCKQINVCRRVAESNAIVDYANRASGYIQGRVASETDFVGTENNSKELDDYYAAYERIVGAEIQKGVIRESFSLRKETSSGKNEYKIVFLLNEETAAQVREEANKRALQESKLGQDRSRAISKFVQEPIPTTLSNE